jgi:pilus assembly protein CpaF
MFGKRSDTDRAKNGRAVMPLAPQGGPGDDVVAETRAAPEPTVVQKLVTTDKPRSDQGYGGKRSAEYYGIKTTVFNALIDTIDLAQLSQVEKSIAREEIRDIVTEILSIKNVIMSISEQEDLLEDICNDVLGYGPLEPLLARDDIADIMINGAFTSYIEVNGKVEPAGVRFADNAQLMNICQRIVSQVGRRVDESSPICDARLPDGSRVNVIAPPLAIDGPALTIRKFKKDKLKLHQLVDFGSITKDGATILEIIGKCRCNVVISGGTGSGKTTLLNCLTAFIESTERIVTCEDSAELQLQQPHVVRLETRPPNLEGEGQITMRDLVKNCLRMRPERIIVGEVRGPEAFDLLQAMNTGHDGSMGTLHSNSPRECIARLESMIMMGGFSLPSKTIREMIVGSVDIIVQASRLRDGSRKITHITEVIGMEGEVPTLQDLFVYEVEGEDDRGKVRGYHRSTGIARPKFWDRARYFNEHVRLAKALADAEVTGGRGGLKEEASFV